MDGLTEGRIVHYVMDNGIHRPAIIVNTWESMENRVNLQVFTDCKNDSEFLPDGEELPSVIWQTSIPYDENANFNTWHWIEKA